MSTQPTFSAARAKIKQGRRHIEAVQRLLDEHNSTLRFTPDIPEQLSSRIPPGSIVVTFGSIAFTGVPEEAITTIGDAIHNLRSALDVLAAEMARLNDPTAQKVAFPFPDTEANLKRHIKDRNFGRCGPKAIEILEQIQPYYGGNDLLRHLHQLDITDKHEILLPVGVAISSPVIDMRTAQIVGDPTKPSNVNYHWPNGNPMQGEPVMTTLTAMADLVEDIVKQFEQALLA
jgi:hypothetical protein